MLDMSAGHSVKGVGLVSSQDRCEGKCHSSGEWRHLVRYQVAQSGTGGLSDEGGGFGSFQVRCECMPFHHGERIKFLPWPM